MDAVPEVHSRRVHFRVGFLELVLSVLGVGYGRFSYGHTSIYWLATMADFQVALETALIIYMLKGAWAAYVKRRRHETRGLRREERVVLKGGSGYEIRGRGPFTKGELLLLLPPGVLSSVVCRSPSTEPNPFMTDSTCFLLLREFTMQQFGESSETIYITR